MTVMILRSVSWEQSITIAQFLTHYDLVSDASSVVIPLKIKMACFLEQKRKQCPCSKAS